MKRKLTILLLIALCAACRKPAPPPPAQPAQQKQPDDNNLLAVRGETDLDGDNLLNLAYGASVVSRTAESNLELSALHAIDGLANTMWSSPPGDGRQSLTFALAARSRIERLGITAVAETAPKSVRFEASLDGKSWRKVLDLKTEASRDPQLADVRPLEARYVRVTITEPRAYFVTLRSVHALGEELERPAPRDFRGCWTVNGLRAQLRQEGARVTGTLATTPPTYLEGGTDGRVARLVWLRSPNRGYAVLSIDPSTRLLSGLTMYEEISSHYVAEAWFGQPCASDAMPLESGERERNEILDRAKRFSIYGLAFDADEHVLENESSATLDALASLIRSRAGLRLRLVAHELQKSDPEPRTQARIASLRAALQKRGVDVAKIEFVAAGSKWDTPPIIGAIQRLLASRIDLEITGR